MSILDDVRARKAGGSSSSGSSFLDQLRSGRKELETQIQQQKTSSPTPKQTNTEPSRADFSKLDSQSMQGVKPPTPQKKVSIPVLDWINENVLEPVDDNVLDPLQNFLNRVASKTVNEATLNVTKKPLIENKMLPEALQKTLQPAQTTSEKTADVLGTITGSILPGAAAYKTGGKLAGKAIQKLAPNAPELARVLGRGAGAGLTYGLADEGLDATLDTRTDGNQTLGQRAGNVALDTILGGGIDAGVYGAGKALSPVLRNLQLSRSINQYNPTFNNSDVSAELNPMPLWQSGQLADVKPFQTQETVLRPNQGMKGKYRVVDPANRQLEQFFRQVDGNPLPPGREYETLQDLWSQSADPESGNLDDLISQIRGASANDMIQAGTKNMDKTKWRAKFGEPFNVGKPETVTKEAIPFDPLKTPRYNYTEPPIGELTPKNSNPKVNQPNPEIPLVSQDKPKSIDDVINTFKKPDPVPKQENERGFVNTLRNSEKSTEPLLDRLKGMYKPISNEETVSKANKRVSDNIEDASRFVLNANRASAENVATAHRLIDEYQKAGEFEKAVDIAEKIAELGTKAGQSIQAFSIYNRLTPEGILVHAQRQVSKVNEKLPVGAAPVEVTKDMAAQLTDLAGTVQKMTGTKDVANDVMSLLEKAKKGEKLNDIETQTIKRFVQEASQFVKTGEVKKRPPKPPKEIKDKRVRDNVVSFLEAQEQAARERIRKKTGRLNSIPIDLYADYAAIGAIKLAKGVVKFADWSEQMVKEFGENIRPQLESIYEKAVDHLNVTSKKISQETISEAEKIANRIINKKGISEEEASTIQELAKKVSSLSGDAKTIASQDLQKVLQELDRPSIGQKISTFQTIMQLFNPKTMVRNVIGNELFYRVERLNKYIATPIDWARVKMFGGQRSVTFSSGDWSNFFKTTEDYWKGFAKGVQAGWKGVNPDGLTSQFDLRPNSFTHKLNPLKYMEKALGATLQGFDYAGYNRAVNQTLREMANLNAINRGLKGDAKKRYLEQFIRNADDNLFSIADEYGKYVTFQDNTFISKGLSSLKKGLNLGKDFGVGDLVLKYPKTPGNLIMRALEYSPAGVLRSAYILAGPWFKREPNAKEVTLALSRAITGTIGFTGLGYFLADKGIITGASDKDKDVRELEKMAGQGQYRVNWDALKRWIENDFDPKSAELKKGDRFISYDWAQPVAVAISMGANISKNIKEGSNKEDSTMDAIETFGSSVEGGVNTLVEQSVLQGVRRSFDAQPNQTVTDKMVDILGDAPASFAPTLGNQINQFNDNAFRSTYSPDKLTEFMNRVKKKVPGVAQQLPQEYDTLGKPKEVFQDGTNSLFNVFLNPSFVGKYNPSPEAKLVIDVIKETGDKTIAPRSTQKSINVTTRADGKKVTERVKLTPEQFVQLQKLVGEETAKGLSRINPNLNNTKKIDRILDVLNKAGEKGRKVIQKEIQKGGQ